MTMETKNSQEVRAESSSSDSVDSRLSSESVDSRPSADGEDSKSTVDTSVKKPPGEIDPSEYEVEVKGDDNDNEELIIGDTSDYSVSQRNSLFQKGLEFEKKDKSDLALKCYLSCLKGLQNKTRFALLPECLKNIADIYQAKGEYANAIHFAQAEKLFYETALIETQEIQKKIEEITGNLNVDAIPEDLNHLNIEAMRAEEYEHLARLCLDNKQAQLALEYAGKCAKIRQQVYGSNHAKTRETLDLFASLYAEVGKEQYSESIEAMASTLEGENVSDEAQVIPEIIQSVEHSAEPVSILRQRSTTSKKSNDKEEGAPKTADREKKQVRFHESVDESIRLKRKEEMVSIAITVLLLIVCFFILLALGVWLFCSLEKSRTCPAWMSTLKTWTMTIRYYINRLTNTDVSSNPSSHKTEYSR